MRIKASPGNPASECLTSTLPVFSVVEAGNSEGLFLGDSDWHVLRASTQAWFVSTVGVKRTKPQYLIHRIWVLFSVRDEQIDQLTHYHTYVPTFALSSGLRMWIKLIMSHNYVEKEQPPHTEFKVEVSLWCKWSQIHLVLLPKPTCLGNTLFSQGFTRKKMTHLRVTRQWF